jgi:heptaprenyl diphosphate synthase
MNYVMDKKVASTAGTQNDRTKRMVLTGLLFAMSLVLSLVESSLPPLPIPVPNIVVMYALFLLNKRTAVMISVLKALFVCFTRGLVSGFLSLSGGLLSILVMAVLLLVFKDRISYLLASISGAVFHNIGQFLAICLIYTNMNLWVYLPVLIISGIAAGILTATLLKVVIPVLRRTGLA